MSPTIEQKTDDYDHVRFEDSDEFDTIRTPGWAERHASSIAEGAEVRTGHHEGGDDSDREIQSVLVLAGQASDEAEATGLAEEIVEKINS